MSKSFHSDHVFPGASDLTGRRLGDLQILRRLGRGGMADVYVANQLSLGRRVAVKVLRAEFARDINYVERFRREARAAAKLSHPNIVQIYEVGCVDSTHYILQEYVDGLNLRQQLDRTGPLTPDQAVVVLQSVADALDAASAGGVTHRDIKPENVMVNQRGEIKVADFGLARVAQGEVNNELTQVGMTMGTPLYMSPEQVQGKDVDVRSDLYSLGVTLYHLLAGRPPFEADSPLSLAVKHLHDSPLPLEEARPVHDLPNWLCVAVARLMEKNPERRFQSPAELSQFVRHSMNENGPLGNATAELATRIDATKTLQRLLREERSFSKSKGFLQRVLLVTCPALLFMIAAWMGRLENPQSVRSLLAENEFEVSTQSSVGAQYLEAARLNEPEAWRKVSEAFPPSDSPINAAYALKANIQLSRLYRARGQFNEAESCLTTVLQESGLASHYRAIALAELLQTLTAANNLSEATRIRGELRQAYQALQATPDKMLLFDSIVPAEIVRTLKPS